MTPGRLRRLLGSRAASYLLPASLTGYLWLKGAHPGLPGWPCPLRALTGVPCPTCFLTRATELALRGELAGAVELHAFGPLLAAGLIGWSLLALQQRRLWPQPLARWSRQPWPLGLVVIALFSYWLLRLGLGLFPSG